MKVLYVLNSTFEAGGATKSFLIMLKGLVSKGVEPHVLVPDNKGVCQTLMNNHIVTHVLNYRAQVYPKANSCRNVILFLPRLIVNQMLNFRAGRLLKQIVREQKYDIIHTNVSVVNIGFKVAKKLKIKHLYHIREYGDLDFNLKYFPTKSTLLKILKGRHTFSACITKDLQRYYGLQNSEMSRVIYNGIIGKVNQASEKQINDNDRFFLFAGRIEKPKGVDSLIRAYVKYAEKVEGKPLPLYLAGEICDRDYYEKIVEYIHNNNIKESVVFLGQVEKITELMAKAWAIIIPSLNEGFGRCMAEAMSVNCLVIGRNTGGTKEQFDNGLQMTGTEIGLRFSGTDELRQILTDVSKMTMDEREKYVQPAFDTVSRLYTAENNINSVFDFYQHILNVQAD